MLGRVDAGRVVGGVGGAVVGGIGRAVVGVGGVGGAVEAADAGGLFVSVGAHVGVGGLFRLFAVAGGAPLARSLFAGFLLGEFDGVGDGGRGERRHDAAAAEVGRFGRAGEGGSVRAFAPQHRRFVLFPVAFAEDEAAVFGPEEEPDG